MKTFAYESVSAQQFSPACRALIKRVREDKGTMAAVRSMYPKLLKKLEADAHFDSVDASARLEGIYQDPERVRALIGGDAPQTDAEGQIAGYAAALRAIHAGRPLIHESDEARKASTTGKTGWRDPAAIAEAEGRETRGMEPGELAGLHALLFANRPSSGRSRYRRRDHMRMMVDGRLQPVKVSPIAAFETPLYTGSACDSLCEALDADGETLSIIPEFCVDLMCVRPFDEGTGRVMRLASELLLMRAGYDIGRFVSLERLFEQDGTAYYEALNACAEGWDANKNDYEPFVVYWLQTVHAAYQKLFSLTTLGEGGAASKADRVRHFVETYPGPIAKRDVVTACKDVSLSTIEATLGALVREGRLRKVGGGRGTVYELVEPKA